jgi:hypothetical protein
MMALTAVVMKVKNLNGIALKLQALSFYMALTVCFYHVYVQSY